MAADDVRAAVHAELARTMQGEQIEVVQRGPLVFVHVAGPMTANTASELAHALLPTVERIARELAADELDAEAAYDDAEPDALYPRRSFAARVRQRADNLRAEAAERGEA